MLTIRHIEHISNITQHFFSTVSALAPLIPVSRCVFFPFPKLGQLSNALRWSAGFGLCSYFAVRLLC